MRQETNWVLLLEAGDVFGRSVQIEQKKAGLSIEAMARMGYGAYNLGARELILGQEFIRKQTERSGIPLLCANVMLAEGETPFAIPYHIIKDLGGVRVGSPWADVQPFHCTPPYGRGQTHSGTRLPGAGFAGSSPSFNANARW